MYSGKIYNSRIAIKTIMLYKFLESNKMDSLSKDKQSLTKKITGYLRNNEKDLCFNFIINIFAADQKTLYVLN